MLTMTADVQGMSLCIQNLGKLSQRAQTSSLRKAATQAAKPWQKAAKRSAPRFTGLMAKSMIVKVKARKGKVTAVVGPRNRRVDGNRNPNKYAHIVEGGAKPHVIPTGAIPTKGGKWIRAYDIQHPGFAGRHFMRRAAKQSERQVVEVFKDVLRIEVEDAANSLPKPKWVY